MRLSLFCSSFLALCISPATGAFDKLTPAQELIYEKPHLVNTAAGDEIHYRYRGASDGNKPVEDEVTVSITGVVEEERRDVSIDFLSDERRVNLPDFSGYRGNPVIIAMLEHVARSLGEETGGGTLYFRNRIRDSLAQPKIAIGESKIDYGEQEVTGELIEFRPFEGDSYLAGFPAIASLIFKLTFSDEVPGGVAGIEVASVADGEHAFTSTLRIAPEGP